MSGGFVGYSSLFSKKNIIVPVSADGGIITDYNGYKIHTFNSSGTFTVASDSMIAEILVVAGGGSGFYA